MKNFVALILLVCATSAVTAQAASDDAWTTFQADVGKACVAASKDLIENGRAVVDPFGSQSYGLAVVTGKAKGAKVRISTICAYDKKTKKAEVGGEISANMLRAKPGK
jgi:hypothetical protein